ncbi:MAG: hypothetical protein U5K70_04375 [Halodesulfurarchaeum sp.]|nr:hypothetical protein [Halodesulfurarchaeum sp.]
MPEIELQRVLVLVAEVLEPHVVLVQRLGTFRGETFRMTRVA